MSQQSELNQPSRKSAMDDILTHINAGNIKQAQVLLEELLVADPGNAQAMILMGRIALHFNNYSQAIESIIPALKLHPNHVGLLSDLGVAKIGQGHWDEALELYERVLHLEPGHTKALCQKGKILLHQKKLYLWG